jgi:4-amino-4-deoxy-L-arabinose transferase-like glycosyltransferase
VAPTNIFNARDGALHMTTTAGGSRSSIGLASLTLLIAAAHLLFLGTPPINMEFAFSDAAKYFSSGEPQYIEQYFHYEANTLAIPWLAFAINWLFPFLNIDHIPRLLSVLGIPFLTFGVLRINRQLAQRINPYLLVSLVLLNPLVWTFAGRGTADFLPAAIAVFALSLFWNGDEESRTDLWRRILASATLGLAAVVKYHALLLLAGVLAEIAIRRRAQYGKMLLQWIACAAPAIFVVGAYLIVVKIVFGFWLTPPEFQQRHGINLFTVPNNFLSYAGFLVLITIPFSLAISWPWVIESRSRRGAVALVLAITFIAGYFSCRTTAR